MQVETKITGNGLVEMQFSDAFTVADHAAVQAIVEGLAKLRKDYAHNVL